MSDFAGQVPGYFLANLEQVGLANGARKAKAFGNCGGLVDRFLGQGIPAGAGVFLERAIYFAWIHHPTGIGHVIG